MAQQRTRDEVLDRIVRLSKLPREDLLAAVSIDDILEPMAVIEIVFELEEAYGLEIDDNDVLAIVSVEDLVLCILEQLDVAA